MKQSLSKYNFFAVIIISNLSFAAESILIQELKLLEESVEQESVPRNTDDVYTSSNYPQSITSGNYPNAITNGSYPNSYTSGSYPSAYTSGNYSNPASRSATPNEMGNGKSKEGEVLIELVPEPIDARE